MKPQATPNLFRAVAECTQPYGPPASGSSARLLQTYLSNERCVDSVYRAILARAIAEPQSEAVVARCIALIKQHVNRFPPSAAALEAIAVACQRLAASLPPDSGLRKSLVYLEASVACLADGSATSRTVTQFHPRSAGSSSPRPWLQAAINGDINRSRGSTSFSAHSSTSADDVQSRQAPSSPAKGSFEQQLQLQQQQGFGSLGAALPQHEEEQDESDGDRDGSEQQLQEQTAFRVLGNQIGLPDWTFQPSALQDLWCHQPDSEVAELDWSLLLPHYSPSLVPLVEGLPGMEVLHMLSSQEIMDELIDADQQTMLRQMQEVTEVRRVQAGVTDELIQQALKQNSTNRARRLFHPLPYTQQEHMAANGTDVAAVVEIMCGKVSPAAPSAITGTVGLNDPSLYWQPRQALQQQQPLLLLYPQPGQQQQQSHAESIGQISSCILMKLIVDLWLSAGTVAAFPLVQRMLQQALYQSQAEYRAMAFDIIYNLSLHGTMLLGTQASGSGSPVLQTDLTAQNGIAVAGTQLQQGGLQQQQQQYQYQQDLQQLARLQQLNTTQGRYELSNSVAGAGGGGGGRAQGSPTGSVASGDEAQSNSRASLDSRQGSAGARSSHSSPRIHLPPQLLAPQKPPQQQQPSVVSQLSSSSPVASPKGRSRLSRSDLRITAEQQEQRRSSTSSFRGSSAGVAAADAERTGASTRVGADRLDTTVEAAVEAGEHEAADRRGEVPMEVSWESWLQQLLYELLLMLAMLDEPSETVWQSAVGCLFHLTTHGGYWVANSLQLLPPAAAAALLDASLKFHWSQELHARLVQMSVNLLYLTDAPPAAVGSPRTAVGADGSSSAAAAEGSTVGAGQHIADKAWQQPPRSRSPSRWHQQRWHRPRSTDNLQHQHGEIEQEGSDSASDEAPQRRSPSKRNSFRNSLRASISSSYRLREGHSAAAVLDLPCQLHAGPVDEDQLAAFGGPQQLAKHFCYASSIDAQRTLLVPLLQVLMPDDAPDASQLAVLQALCSSSNCLAALQVALSAGLPGWADGIVSAVVQLLDDQELDTQLLATVLRRLEQLTLGQFQAASSAAERGQHAVSGVTAGQAAAVKGVANVPAQHQQLDCVNEPAEGGSAAAAVCGVAMLPEVELAMQVTLQQLAGQLPAQQVSRPGSDGTEIVTYQVQTEVQGCWKALKALCWCDNESARRVLRLWLQQLLAMTLQQSQKNAILLPLPGVLQRPATAPSTISSADTRSAASPAVTAAVHAACDSWADILQQLVTHCTQGPNTLVDALQLQITSFKLHLSSEVYDPGAAAAAAAAAEPPGPAAGGSSIHQLKQRAAAARMCVQGWAFVSQWVLQARTAVSHTALTRLAGIAQTLACVHEVPDWIDAAVAPTSAGDAAAGAVVKAANSSRDKLSSLNGASGLPAASMSEAGSDLALPMPPAASLGREEDVTLKGVPPLEPSSEPSSLAALLAAEGRGGAAGCATAGQAAAAAAAEAVCWPQAFLLGRALLPQQMAQVLAGSSLALLLVRLLQCKQLDRAADRGFKGRPCSIRSSSHSNTTRSCQNTAAAGGQCHVLYPWSDDRLDLQLGLLLMLMSGCGNDADNYKDFGLEAVTQQILSRCTDPRACLLVSQFKLDYSMRHQQDDYWASLRTLVATAQQKNDERLLGNPFLQLITVLSTQEEEKEQQERKKQQEDERHRNQKQQHPQPTSSASVSPSQAPSVSSGRAGPASH